MEFVINRSLVKMIDQVIDEDGSVKDSASPALKQSRQQVQVLERKIQHLMESLIRNEKGETSILEVNNIDGRWCIRVDSGQKTSFKGLLLFSGSGVGSTIEPLSAVPLNDELQRARTLVAKAESEVLLALTQKMQLDLDDIENILNSMVQLDVINARATYGLSFGGSSPHIFLPDRDSSSTAEASTRNDNYSGPLPNNRDWTLYLPKAYHPLLLQRHKENVKKRKNDVNLSTSVATMDNAHPVPVDFFVSKKTRVVVITGPNTGGKTICLKTVGLAAMMAKSGLYVLASESVQIPWFDSVFADIGDEQSLSQSLSTFSGHLKQISNIKLKSTIQSLVLLDEVGAGTNPLEGAALGMSLLESFAQDGCLLTIATTHHGELKTLKYSNDAFENACMEFDDVNLKPTYKILWGVPGRSNAINIAERLGLPSVVLDTARKLYGSASAEIDEVITDMEKLKQDYQELLDEGYHHLMLSRKLYNSLLSTKRKIMKHSSNLRFKKMRDVSEAAAMARSILHKKVRQLDASSKKPLQPSKTINSSQSSATKNCHTAADNKEPTTTADGSASSVKKINQLSPDRSELPKVGDMVNVTSLGRKAAVLKVDSSKGEIVVQAGSMKLKLKVTDIKKS
ncbi:putative DNA mismatch repair protein MutS [Lupinus albus]|uniref:Putative DNA mismatch repair protein MutS n=1 Tax=Lupinus albus TaxID=3870 RepID=A0A6A4PWD0_LUPAL|nr:putative DNA mismatch repair protein MutS [Lupinus albus]